MIVVAILFSQALLADIQNLSIKVGGMVCTACVSTMQNLLKKVEGVAQAPGVNLKSGTVSIKIDQNNADSLVTLHKRLVNAIKKSTYRLENLDEVVVTGTVKKGQTGYYFLVSKTNDKIHFQKKLFNKFVKQFKKLYQKKSVVLLKAKIIRHDKEFIVTKIIKLK